MGDWCIGQKNSTEVNEMDMDMLFKVYMVALNIYIGGTGIVGFWLTCYGLCYPGFFVTHRKVLCWAAVAWVSGSLSCATVLGIAALFTYLI